MIQIKYDVFLISPVRGVTEEELKSINNYVTELERQNKVVYVPGRDTDQSDPIGTRICNDNFQAIKNSKEVHIWYSPNSQGSIFDIGMTWALRKPLYIVNKEAITPTPYKSFQNVMMNWNDAIE